MSAYANLHIAFEAMRVRAIQHYQGTEPPVKSPSRSSEPESKDPPRVLILGPENSGKTTVAKILVNYAARAGQDWCPFLVNADPSEVRFLTFER